MPRKKKTQSYPESFRREAVRLADQSGCTATEWWFPSIDPAIRRQVLPYRHCCRAQDTTPNRQFRPLHPRESHRE